MFIYSESLEMEDIITVNSIQETMKNEFDCGKTDANPKPTDQTLTEHSTRISLRKSEITCTRSYENEK